MAQHHAPAHTFTRALLAPHTHTHTPQHGTCSTAHTPSCSHTCTGTTHAMPLTLSCWQGTASTTHTPAPGCTPTEYPQAHTHREPTDTHSQARTPVHTVMDECRWTRVAHAQPCTHSHAPVCAYVCVHTHTEPLMMAPRTHSFATAHAQQGRHYAPSPVPLPMPRGCQPWAV